jgi:rare lipoprotein A
MRGANSFMPALLLAVAIAPLSVEAHHYRRVQLGLASYYGAEFRGQETASGEIYDQHELVAAHRTLPLGSVVRVTNLENGRTVKLRVIDRGPYGRNRRKGCIIDVSTAAARRLGFIRAGLTRVRVYVLKLGDNDRSDDRDRR